MFLANNKPMILASVMAASLLGGCDFFNKSCPCTDIYIANVCVEGVYDDQDSVSYQREIRTGRIDDQQDLNENVVNVDGPLLSDCFSESGEEQRILVVKDSAVIDSSDWFKQESEDGCCHYKAYTVTFD